jgi:hypothetical protein
VTAAVDAMGAPNVNSTATVVVLVPVVVVVVVTGTWVRTVGSVVELGDITARVAFAAVLSKHFS